MKNKITRNERKWFFGNVNYLFITNALIRSEFLFRKAFPPRQVNSIYFDDLDYKSLKQNLDGNFEKKKIRIRWYGSKDKIYNAQLEIKEKKGFQTFKETLKLSEIDGKTPTNFNDLNEIRKILDKKFLKLNTLCPVLTTHYEREYFISNNNLIRATVDKNLQSIFLNNYKMLNINKNFEGTILEMKYNNNLDNFVREKLNKISARLSKSSKYVRTAISSPLYYS